MRITSNIKANIRQTLRDLPDGRQVYDIILDQIPSQEDEITISCERDFPICNIAGRWHPNCRYDRTLKADWAHGEISMSSVSAPLNVFFSTDGRNIKTIAVSEAEKNPDPINKIINKTIWIELLVELSNLYHSPTYIFSYYLVL